MDELQKGFFDTCEARLAALRQTRLVRGASPDLVDQTVNRATLDLVVIAAAALDVAVALMEGEDSLAATAAREAKCDVDDARERLERRVRLMRE